MNRAKEAKRSTEQVKATVPWNDLVFCRFLKAKYHVNTEKFNEFFTPDGSQLGRLTDSIWGGLMGLIDPTKSPSAPLKFVTSTNRGLLKYNTELRYSVDKRLNLLYWLGRDNWENGLPLLRTILRGDPAEIKALSEDLVFRGYCDQVTISAKGEPREKGKNPRIIFGCSVRDVTTARVVLHNALQTEQSYDDLPTATKLDITSPEGRQSIYSMFSRQGVLNSSDIRGWDFSHGIRELLRAFLMHAHCMGLYDVETRRLIPQPGRDPYAHFFTLLGLYLVQLVAQLVFPDGTVLTSEPGIMFSGKLTTYSDNCLARASLANDVWYELYGTIIKFIKTGGDDCMDRVPHSPQLYLKRGFVVTDFISSGAEFDFCSTILRDGSGYQKNIFKAAFAMLIKTECNPAEEKQAFDSCFSHHPEFNRVRDRMSAIRW